MLKIQYLSLLMTLPLSIDVYFSQLCLLELILSLQPVSTRQSPVFLFFNQPPYFTCYVSYQVKQQRPSCSRFSARLCPRTLKIDYLGRKLSRLCPIGWEWDRNVYGNENCFEVSSLLEKSTKSINVCVSFFDGTAYSSAATTTACLPLLSSLLHVATEPYPYPMYYTMIYRICTLCPTG